MKKYFLIPILSGLLFTVSCTDQLDRVPVDSLVEATAFQTVSDLENGITGALGNLNPDNMVAFNAIFTLFGISLAGTNFILSLLIIVYSFLTLLYEKN